MKYRNPLPKVRSISGPIGRRRTEDARSREQAERVLDCTSPLCPTHPPTGHREPERTGELSAPLRRRPRTLAIRMRRARSTKRNSERTRKGETRGRTIEGEKARAERAKEILTRQGTPESCDSLAPTFLIPFSSPRVLARISVILARRA